MRGFVDSNNNSRGSFLKLDVARYERDFVDDRGACKGTVFFFVNGDWYEGGYVGDNGYKGDFEDGKFHHTVTFILC